MGKTEVQRTRQIDVGRAFKLRIAGLTYEEIAEALGGYSTSGVYDALRGFTALLENPEVIRAYRENQTEIIDGIGAQITSILASKLHDKKEQAKLSPYQLMGMFGISFDKSQELKGKRGIDLNSLSALVVGAAKAFVSVSRETNAVSDPENEPIDVTEEPNNIKSGNTDGKSGS